MVQQAHMNMVTGTSVVSETKLCSRYYKTLMNARPLGANASNFSIVQLRRSSVFIANVSFLSTRLL
ncbi:hypothetical protein SAMN04487894_112104 [Niabella drilacis]|uniref:Uncharacterized protein n=1 Tax=Niabella drilacis (strain DSM 25811 / CCM 8410 / CCUG 62505 / LMG 26954 / E90) TaxID=1285928 RepID=A0A1G6X264_NIADE|nr:hypothetical protein SAMN04487894_112104 [Niabella drilacis]